MARGRGRGRGGGGRGRGRGKGGRGGGGQHRNFQDNRQSFDEVRKENEKMELFYNTINIVPHGPEREAFWSALRKELPNSFRFTGSKGHALGVRDNLVNRYFPIIRQLMHENQPVKPPTQMPWYPEGLGYRMDTPKNVIRKYDGFKEFQKFLVSETGVGNISRQEEVSMIPPLLLDVEPQHTVLDLCAAPGSKSAQLIELIHAGEEERVQRAIAHSKGESPSNGVAVSGDVMEDGGRTTGLLIANDFNYQRAQMLVHQVKRLNSPNLLVMNHDAAMFPSIELPPVTTANNNKRGKYLKFDRILADVPCSGDGTCRKNPSIWKEWSPQNGLGLHLQQSRILTRALQMLKVGGRVVYSTCSMNPVENEAVVAAAIERCGGVSKVKLVDCSDRLPGLMRCPGLTDWSIMSRSGSIYESWAEAVQFENPDSRVMPSMFPPDAEEQIPLQNCWRVYPHQQNTGGFFIAALEKLGEIRAKPENESKSGNKDWKYVAPEEPTLSAVPETAGDSAPSAFDELLGELGTGNTDIATTVPDAPSGNTSAAQRQNDPTGDSPSSAKKRGAPDDADESQPLKKVKSTQEVIVANANGNASTAEASSEVADAAATAPFEKSIPPEAVHLPRKRRDDQTNEEAFKYLALDHPELVSIYKFYELHPSFPRNRFLVRNPAGDPVKGIYYSSELIKDILTQNEGRGMRFVHGGVKMFMKQDAQGQDICRWRIQTEGLPIVEGWVGEGRIVRLKSKRTLRKLLTEMFPKLPTTKHEDGTESGGWMDLGEVGEQIKDMSMGCCVLRADGSSDATQDDLKEPLVLPLWRSMYSVNLMLPKEDRKAMLLRIYNEDVELINHSDPKQKGRADVNGGSSKPSQGSIPAEVVAKELERKVQEAGDEDDDDMDVNMGDAAGNGVSDESAMALEQDALHAKDEVEAKRLEVLEDENRKIAEAMPEREDEGDDYNTTV